jgi:hypothetical protein
MVAKWTQIIGYIPTYIGTHMTDEPMVLQVVSHSESVTLAVK